jgi:Domain of unknown function (DUF6430)
MMDALKTLAKQPYWIIAQVIGAGLVLLSCVSLDKDNHWTAHAPGSYWLLGTGVALLLLSFAAFAFVQWLAHITHGEALEGAGLDLTTVQEHEGALVTRVGSCKIRVIFGRVEEQLPEPGAVMVLPCNEYFDDLCVEDPRTALGAYAKRVFDGQAADLVKLIRNECRSRWKTSGEYQKTDSERAESFGVGRCLLLQNPLGRSAMIALVSTATQRAGQGLAAQISYVFAGMRDLVARMADARLEKITMPVLGSGKGGIDAPLALVGLLLAVAEAARYVDGGRQLKAVTIVVFKGAHDQPDGVNRFVVRRALALIGSHG